jgi:hypothetical protein
VLYTKVSDIETNTCSYASKRGRKVFSSFEVFNEEILQSLLTVNGVAFDAFLWWLTACFLLDSCGRY